MGNKDMPFWAEAMIGIIILIIVCIAGGFLMNYRFHIYQKKHGEKMTFIEFLLDSERK